MIPTLVVIKGTFFSSKQKASLDFKLLSDNPNIRIVKTSRIDYYYRSNIVSLTKNCTFTIYLTQDIEELILHQNLIILNLYETFLHHFSEATCSYKVVNIHFKGNLSKPRGWLKLHLAKYITHPKLKCYCRDSECSLLIAVTSDNFDTAFAHSQYFHFVCKEGTLRVKVSGYFSIICKGTQYIDFWVNFAKEFEPI
jgi:hypothetical protein